MPAAVLEKINEFQQAFSEDIQARGQQMIDAITQGDEATEQRLKNEIRSLHALQERSRPMISEITQFLSDNNLGMHPADEGRPLLAAYEGKEKIPQVQEPEVPKARQDVSLELPLEEAEKVDSAPAETPTLEATSTEEPAKKDEEEEKEYNKSEVYTPFFLEAIHALPEAKMTDLQKRTLDLMQSAKIAGHVVAKEGDATKTKSGVYRYKATTQNLLTKFLKNGLVVKEEGKLKLSEEGEKQRWGKMRSPAQQKWALSLGLINESHLEIQREKDDSQVTGGDD